MKHFGIECIPIFNFNIHALCNLVHKLLVILQNWEVISLQLNVQSIIQWNLCLSSLKERYNKQFLQLKPIMMKNEKLCEAHDFQFSTLWHTVPEDFVFIVQKKINFIVLARVFTYQKIKIKLFKLIINQLFRQDTMHTCTGWQCIYIWNF
jgi:hypothetical protein